MSVRLLLDENLSERLLPGLATRFPGSAHVRARGLGGSTDTALWDLARREGFLFVTRDEDFVSLSVLRGAPPKIVWLNIGNAGNTEIGTLLQQHADAIEQFAQHPDASFLALAFGARPG